jgi:hypothetical protein
MTAFGDFTIAVPAQWNGRWQSDCRKKDASLHKVIDSILTVGRTPMDYPVSAVERNPGISITRLA